MPDGGSFKVQTAAEYVGVEHAARLHGKPQAGRYLILSVTDTGAGTAWYTLNRAAERFYSSAAEGTGMGIGLSQILGFVKHSKGGIRIQSRLDSWIRNSNLSAGCRRSRDQFAARVCITDRLRQGVTSSLFLCRSRRALGAAQPFRAAGLMLIGRGRHRSPAVSA
jgi:signal transduction histidine kinase